MKKILLSGALLLSPVLVIHGQVKSQPSPAAQQSLDNLQLRPNSRDYAIIRKGNNHQRMIQLRTQAMIRHKQAMQNRKMNMDRRRTALQRQMIKQQQIRQRMIHKREIHR